MAKVISGTGEWAVANFNCARGCQNDCRYCYAKARAVKRFHWCEAKDWPKQQVNWKEARKKRKLVDGRCMFPTSHDIVPGNLDACVMLMNNLLEAGNFVLVVSKPHKDCIKAICERFGAYKDKMLFRFTIGAMDDDILKYWEPGAPPLAERVECLKHAFEQGFQTSVSAEPMLDAPNAPALYDALEPYVTDAIWFGKLNKIEQRVPVENDEDKRRVARIVLEQTDEKIKELYAALKGRPKVKWKESVKAIVGLPLPKEKGTDQ
jgi:DNA repair photolyase